MQLVGRTVLLTGGSSGIGLALAQRLLAAGATVIATGRREDALEQARAQCPTLRTFVNDVGDRAERERLAAWIEREQIAVDMLINNAGIQKHLDAADLRDWEASSEELRINLEAPMHLTSLLLPALRARESAWVINVSSGLAFAPLARVPVYCATKAALHSFTQSLRYALRESNVRVIEVIPPAVRSNLGGSHDFGVPTDEYADSVMEGLAQDREEIAYQFSAQASGASRAQLDEMFRRLNP